MNYIKNIQQFSTNMSSYALLQWKLNWKISQLIIRSDKVVNYSLKFLKQ